MNYLSLPAFKKLSRIVLGGRFGEQDDDLSFDILDTYVSLGGNVIDTAHTNADGASERLIGQWMKMRGNRDQIIIVDKGCHPTVRESKRVSPNHIRIDIQESLERLGTSFIDIYLLHRDDESVEVGVLLETLNEEKSAGHILAFGVSNWSNQRIAKSIEYARRNKIEGFCVSSCNLSLVVPKEPIYPGSISLDLESRKWYREAQFPVMAWSSQARGWLSGAYIRNERFDPKVIRCYDSKENRSKLKRLEELAQYKHVSPMQCAVAYVLSQPFPTFAIIGPQLPAELLESAAVPELVLLEDEIEFLEKGTI